MQLQSGTCAGSIIDWLCPSPKACLFVIGCLATLVAGSDNYTEIADLPALPHYEVQRVSGGVAVDGVLNDLAWKAYGVRAISLMFPWASVLNGSLQDTQVSKAVFLTVLIECRTSASFKRCRHVCLGWR
jgi:hypothetical protein